MNDENIKLFTTSQAADKVGLTPPTFRKYLRYLEEDYHEIKRDSESNYRLFNTYNLAMIQRMIEYTKRPGWTVKEAARQAADDKEDVYKTVDTERTKDGMKDSTTLDIVDSEAITKLLRGLYDNQKELIENNHRLNEKIERLYSIIHDLKTDNQQMYELLDVKDVKQDDDKTTIDGNDLIEDDDQTTIDDYIDDDKESTEGDNKEPLSNDSKMETEENEPKKKQGILSRLFGRK